MEKMLSDYEIPLTEKDLSLLWDMVDTRFGEMSDFVKLIMGLKAKYEMMPDEKRTSPDTFSCNKIFLDHFITERMSEDFSLIARDFLIHEYPNIEKYEMVEYLDTDATKNRPDQMFERYILNLMMNAVNCGSTYTKNLFLYLHKTYYNKEYKQLKRFTKLSSKELLAFVSSSKGELSPVTMGRILTMSRIYGIEIGLECNFLYLFLDICNEYFDRDLTERKFIDKVTDTYRDCIDEAQQIFDSDEEMYDMYEKCDKFMANLLRAEGFTEDYVVLCDDNDDGLLVRLGRTLAILKKTYRNRTFTKEELILYAAIYQGVSALLSTTENMENRLAEVLYGERGTDYFENFPALFHPADVAKGRSETANDTPARKEVKKEKNNGADSPRYNEEALIAEIDGLHRKIHEQEGSIKALRNEISDKRKMSEELAWLKDRIDTQQKELTALRNHLYNLTEEDETRETVSIDEIKNYLNSLRIIIIGGHKNWRQKMKQDFPDWTYIDAAVSGTLETSVVDKADHVYFFTDTLSHSTYFKYINVVRQHNVDFGYIHGVNIENNMRQMYKELSK